ncbi:ribonuclease HII [Kingella negevensis]|uniref:Ribonuclease HII n=1 Tax=Kingella negevensis TaxID=1522312 RepID=A0A238HKQ2_9NEIS|nr:ribonuclease HII [Kingella negevensis]MDK4689359.1 ribonuclease HII [Kingella negevensis]MDK4698248.1 ribonuclease HII [Kingella negevensis]WII90498.1 ribonuclease HII [Kingella negevensis]WII93780.1 ribonuclease HII [Kingella negevensis]SNB83689.1 Ribonuclease HII [Kingella negevensis]
MNEPELIVLPTHAGVDEAGRGPLVGSVFAAAVILPEHFSLTDLTDSKKLSEKKRDLLAEQIKEQATAWAIASASPQEILQLNILHATMLAMKRAVCSLKMQPEKVWIDGNRVPKDLGIDAEAVVKGDAKIATISAASILAKTARDAEMYALHERYPQYGFAKHKGYGTAVHLAALKEFGVLPEHRADFAPVRELLTQGRLFE